MNRRLSARRMSGRAIPTLDASVVLGSKMSGRWLASSVAGADCGVWTDSASSIALTATGGGTHATRTAANTNVRNLDTIDAIASRPTRLQNLAVSGLLNNGDAAYIAVVGIWTSLDPSQTIFQMRDSGGNVLARMTTSATSKYELCFTAIADTPWLVADTSAPVLVEMYSRAPATSGGVLAVNGVIAGYNGSISYMGADVAQMCFGSRVATGSNPGDFSAAEMIVARTPTMAQRQSLRTNYFAKVYSLSLSNYYSGGVSVA